MRTSSIVGWLFVIALAVAWPTASYAQEAVLAGTIADTTGAVLPGVTVTAVHEATGNTFEGVTDGTGSYRLPVRVGIYRVTAQLPGLVGGGSIDDAITAIDAQIEQQMQ